jgi:hypothetical protein
LYLAKFSPDIRDESWVNTERAFQIEERNVRAYKEMGDYHPTYSERSKYALDEQAMARLRGYIESTPALRQNRDQVDGGLQTNHDQKKPIQVYGQLKLISSLEIERPDHFNYDSWRKWLDRIEN